jgi:hypothetical protein
MRFVIPLELVVEATTHEHALQNARAISRLLADQGVLSPGNMLVSTLRDEGIDTRGMNVKAPYPEGDTNGALRSSGG